MTTFADALKAQIYARDGRHVGRRLLKLFPRASQHRLEVLERIACGRMRLDYDPERDWSKIDWETWFDILVNWILPLLLFLLAL